MRQISGSNLPAPNLTLKRRNDLWKRLGWSEEDNEFTPMTEEDWAKAGGDKLSERVEEIMARLEQEKARQNEAVEEQGV